MGCISSSPHQQRCYEQTDGGRSKPFLFGKYRAGTEAGGVLIPSDIDGLPSCQILSNFKNTAPLYVAQNDEGEAFKCCANWALALPCCWPRAVSMGWNQLSSLCDCTPICCWVKKELSTRTVYRVFSNRIEVSMPSTRFPWACLGCGSWNIDNVRPYVFDRGAFGFRRVRCGSKSHCCCLWEPFGGVVGRQRCPCNGSPWPRAASDCGGWWCDEWLCLYCGCHYHYHGLADPDEAAFASNAALQAYFEGRALDGAAMARLVAFYRARLAPAPLRLPGGQQSQSQAPRDWPVGCLNALCPCPAGLAAYEATHPPRRPPAHGSTPETARVYEKYGSERAFQLRRFRAVEVPSRGRLCDACGFARAFGRRGICFCTEDADRCGSHAFGDAAPAFSHPGAPGSCCQHAGW